MAHDVSAEDLSAFIDDELPAERKAQVAEHLRACASCGRELERFKNAGAAFRAHGRSPLPAGLSERIIRRLPQRWKGSEPRAYPVLRLALVLVLGFVMIAGLALKHFMPGLFSQVQQMISGAASSLGPGK